MSKSEFVHLHTHSEYSLLDGACRLRELPQRAVELGMRALAITDHGVMYGAIAFYRECQSVGIKPIIGCEVYVAPRSRTSREPRKDSDPHHLVLLARNEIGYKNLLKLVTAGSLEGFYYKPRVDRELLAAHSEGLVAMTACLKGEVPRLCAADAYEAAKEAAGRHRDIFGRENFYLELQDHGLPDQAKANELLIRLGREMDIGLVATNDVHYLSRKDASAHEVLLCIQTSTTLDDPGRLQFGSNEFYLKSGEQMAERFAHVPEALRNSVAVAEMCDLDFEFGKPQLPEIEIPEGRTAESHLRMLAWDGVRKRYPEITDEIKERLEYELEVIEKTGFSKYLLVVGDFADFARRSGILVGLRGSAASSVVCYALGISDVDPLKYGLMFERFLNIERVKMPDVDMDIADDRRDELIRYVAGKYGEDHVAQIVTFGTLAAKAAVRDSGRVLGMQPAEVDRVAKLIPSIPVGITIDRAVKENPDLQRMMDESQQVRELIDTARQLEGISRHASTHAAGVIITARPLTEYVPVHRAAKGELVCQYDKDCLEAVGLMKMDFLGLANLTILARSLENVHRTRGEAIDVSEIPLDDQRVFDMLSSGDTTGVFQLEGAGMRRHIQEVKPNSILELAAMIALYRPGPMASIPAFVENKHSGKRIEYMDPRLEPVLRDTYGVMVFQEDVLQVARAIAGFSLGQADILRAAMSKKNAQEMAEAEARFMDGARANGVPEEVARRVFEVIKPFAGYAFNKAHAVCYAILAYRTAYMKCHYPVEYFAALLDAHADNKDKLALYVEECKRSGIAVSPPDVNLGGVDVTIELGPPDRIRLGLAVVKNCGRNVVEGIVRAREKGGPFASLHDLCERLQEEGSFARSAIEVLIKAGALTSIDPNRRRLVESLEDAQKAAVRAQRDKLDGQAGLFGETRQARPHDPRLAEVSDYPREDLLAMEKEILGIYLSEHPLEPYKDLIRPRITVTADQIQDMSDGQPCVVGGVLTHLRHHVTRKKNERMAFITVEDFSGPISVTVFPSVFRECADQLAKDRVVLVRGKTSHRDTNAGDERSHVVEVICEALEFVNAQSAQPAERGGNGESQAAMEQAVPGALEIAIRSAGRSELEALRQVLSRHPGNAPVVILVHEAERVKRVRSPFRVDPSPDLLAELEGLAGLEALSGRAS